MLHDDQICAALPLTQLSIARMIITLDNTFTR